MCPCCCAEWMSTGWPFETAGDEEADASLCPADARDIDACRESTWPSWLTDSYLQSLFSFSQVLHLCWPCDPGWHRIFRRRQHAI